MRRFLFQKIKMKRDKRNAEKRPCFFGIRTGWVVSVGMPARGSGRLRRRRLGSRGLSGIHRSLGPLPLDVLHSGHGVGTLCCCKWMRTRASNRRCPLLPRHNAPGPRRPPAPHRPLPFQAVATVNSNRSTRGFGQPLRARRCTPPAHASYLAPRTTTARQTLGSGSATTPGAGRVPPALYPSGGLGARSHASACPGGKTGHRAV